MEPAQRVITSSGGTRPGEALHRVSVSGAVRTPGGYVPEVDAVRGIAMTLVILIHCKLAPFGWMGVWLFYVISGFSVTTSLFGGRRQTGSVWSTIRAFYARRAIRIWPLYFAYVGANVIVLLALGNTGALKEVPWLLSFTYNLKMIFTQYTVQQPLWSAFGHLWTLSVEQQFYVVFPLLLLLRGRAARAVVLVGIILAAPLVRAFVGHWAIGLGWDTGRAAYAVYAFGPAQFDAFAIGTLIALFRADIVASRRIAAPVCVLAVVVTVAYLGVYGTLGIEHAGRISSEAFRNIISGILYGQDREVFVYWVPTSIGAAILICILTGQQRVLQACRLPGLQAIGRVSYAGYVFHAPVLMTLLALVPAFATPASSIRGIAAHIGLFVCAYPITVGLAWLSFVYFERPISQLARRRRTQPLAKLPATSLSTGAE